MRHVTIKYAGDEIFRQGGSIAKEVNGLTLAGVGNKTIIENITVIDNNDDCFEFFGGDVNPTYLRCIGTKDDAIDVDQDYHGKIRNVFVHIKGPACRDNELLIQSCLNDQRDNERCKTIIESSNSNNWKLENITVVYSDNSNPQTSNKYHKLRKEFSTTKDLQNKFTYCTPSNLIESISSEEIEILFREFN